MKILITGASGFIGRNLISHFLITTTHIIYGTSRKPVDIDSERYTHICSDLSETGWVDAINVTVDVVIHLAQSQYYRDFPVHAKDLVRINIDSTFELLEWSRNAGVKQFILASTGNVYKPSSHALHEDDECMPGSMYAATKISAECIAQQYSSFFQVTIMRLFGVYGPGQENMIMPTMIGRVATGKEIQLASDIGIVLNPLFISDCVKYISELLVTKNLEPYEVLNIAGSETLSLKDIVNKIGKVISKVPDIRVMDSKPNYLEGSIKKVCQLTGYTPSVKFYDGIKATIENNLIGD